uniref:MTH538 TIR-like domain (DUF1863) n=1 Tax=Candidatus Kentrum sp. TC TaxID=2126339 RepID=A0A450Z4Z1_9GAMM|nr:MAG: MTH538 TIR-like domain (DUF1863) [Candidatus Kentron sp. TC]
MGRKVFVSYKHSDSNVENLRDYGDTACAYVDYLVEHRLNDEIYKGEGNEDLSQFKNETIKTHLKKKIHDSSITLVLVSPGMKEPDKAESDQWIPWEISYSLKEITRADRLSHTNGLLAVVLPDSNGSYGYYITQPCSVCKSRCLNTNRLFRILRSNMFNSKNKNETKERCSACGGTSYRGSVSYIESVKWQDFLSNKDHYLNEAAKIRDDRKSYDIVREVDDG